MKAPAYKINLELVERQAEAWEVLEDKTTKELLYGGGAGGGKSVLGVAFSVYICLKYAGIRCVWGRESLKLLKESVLLTFFYLANKWGMREGVDYKYHTDSHIEFFQSGSVIYLKDMGWYPSDPEYDKLGSTEYTFAFVEESQQVRQKAKNILRSRLRYRISEYGLIPKMLLTANPSKGYLYTEFYKPAKEGKLPSDKRFIKALVQDNDFVDATYIDNLRGLDTATKERLLYGNWEYDDDPAALVKYDALVDMFTNKVVGSKAVTAAELEQGMSPHKKYIIVDVARFGGDKTVISYWQGLCCKRIASFVKLPIVSDPQNPSKPSIESKVLEWADLYQVPRSQIMADEDGVGGGLIDRIKCKGFMGGRKPLPAKNGKLENYLNLRAQCYFKLAKYINDHLIAVEAHNEATREAITVECEQIKAKDHDKDGKLQVIPKDEMKEKLGHSPDFADTLMMRMYFELHAVPHIQWLK